MSEIKARIISQVHDWHSRKPFTCDARAGLKARCGSPAAVANPHGIDLTPTCYCSGHEARAMDEQFTAARWGTIRL